MPDLLQLNIGSYNCRGFNSLKRDYVSRLLESAKVDILLLQEHWLSDAQMNVLNDVGSDFLNIGVSGFDNSEVLGGRPYGGCAIIWRSSLMVKIQPLVVPSRRLCAAIIATDSWSLLLVNVYMPYEGDEQKTEEFTDLLILIENIMVSNSVTHVIVGGDFNVEFSRNKVHTALLNTFCDNTGLSPAIRHSLCNIDYTYNFGMSRFNILDHFLLSGTLFDVGVSSAFVVHEVDNLSDHDPIILQLSLDIRHITVSSRAFTSHVSWVKASDRDLHNYQLSLACNLRAISVPTEALLCRDIRCQSSEHYNQLSRYIVDISHACLCAGESCIPHTCSRHTGKRIPGWSESVEPHRQRSLFWHGLWVECGRPRSGEVAECMRRTRANYHRAIRQIRKNEDDIIRRRFADALIRDPSRDFWAEVKKMRRIKAGTSMIVDNCSDAESISQLFAAKFQNLFTSVPYQSDDLQCIMSDVEAKLSLGPDCFVNSQEVLIALCKLKSSKNDGDLGLASDYFINAGSDLSVHIALLFSGIISHGFVPSNLLYSTIIPIPKKSGLNATHSDNYRGIALSSIFGKIFDNVILVKYNDKLNTSNLQFGFKRNSSTHMCTLVLKETVSYYVNNNSSVFCTFLDASKAFDRVHYCKLFYLLLKRGIPACIIRVLINLYTGHSIRVLWAGLLSDCFLALNGVKQGGVLSPVLFCIYIDDLLIRLAQCGVGCYIGFSFVGALAYADDIVLIAPSASSMRKLLSICDVYAAEYNILFNADKSKCVAFVRSNLQRVKAIDDCIFNIGGHSIENVRSYPHLGHIIASSLDDSEDILQRRNCFIGQVNNIVCFFDKLSWTTKLSLYKAYCSSIFGCELWLLDNCSIEKFCVAWRKGLRRVLNLPRATHNYFLPLLSNSLPIYDEICKRSARFIAACLCSDNDLVKSVVNYGILARCHSVVGRNVMLLSRRYAWLRDQLVSGQLLLRNADFMAHYMSTVASDDIRSAHFAMELLFLREHSWEFINYSMSFSSDEIDDLLSAVLS